MSIEVKTELFLLSVEDEIINARNKFPNSRRSFAALVEEVGELAEALLEVIEKKGEFDEKYLMQRIFEEAVQVACMACRVAIEGDKSLTEE